MHEANRSSRYARARATFAAEGASGAGGSAAALSQYRAVCARRAQSASSSSSGSCAESARANAYSRSMHAERATSRTTTDLKRQAGPPSSRDAAPIPCDSANACANRPTGTTTLRYMSGASSKGLQPCTSPGPNSTKSSSPRSCTSPRHVMRRRPPTIWPMVQKSWKWSGNGCTMPSSVTNSTPGHGPNGAMRRFSAPMSGSASRAPRTSGRAFQDSIVSIQNLSSKQETIPRTAPSRLYEIAGGSARLLRAPRIRVYPYRCFT